MDDWELHIICPECGWHCSINKGSIPINTECCPECDFTWENWTVIYMMARDSSNPSQEYWEVRP